MASSPEVKFQYEPLLRKQMPELDSIRGLAILGVVFYHGLYWARDSSPFTSVQKHVLFLISPGQFGVNLFFVLSGFLITGLLLDSRTHSDYYKRFYIRRALRILPAYYAILLFLVVTRLTSNSFLLMSLLYCSNLSPLFGISMSYAVLWSLAVEEHFYLAWPLAVRRISPKLLMGIAAGIIALSPVLRLLCFWHTAMRNIPGEGCFYYTWNTADGLACGALLSIAVREFGSSRRRLLQLSLIFFALAVFLTLVGWPYGITTRKTAIGAALQWTPWNFIFTGLLGLFLLAGTSRWKAYVVPPILLFFGRVSYGLYLLHLLFFRAYDRLLPRIAPQTLLNLGSWGALWVRFAIAGAAGVAGAYLSRRFFEEPFLRLKVRFPPSSNHTVVEAN